MARIYEEGTFKLDGLIEGPIFGPEDQQYLEDLIRQAQSHGIQLNLSSDGGRFSMLPGLDSIKLNSNSSARALVSSLLENWLSNYNDQECCQIMSTLRSVEYVPGKELQVLYGIAPNGKIHAEQRAVDCQTTPPPEPLDPKVIKKMVLYGVGVAFVVILISTLFVPYREIGGRIWNNIKPYDTGSIEITSTYKDIMILDSVEYDKKESVLKIIMNLSPELILSPQTISERWKSNEITLSEKLALEAIVKRTIICDLFNNKGEYITRTNRRLFIDTQSPGKCYILVPVSRKVSKIEMY